MQGDDPSTRLEFETVGRISDEKQLEAPKEKKKGDRVRYEVGGYNSYFSLPKSKIKRFIQFC